MPKVNANNISKIWFSKDPNSFLRVQDMEKIFFFVTDHPTQMLNLFYSSKILNDDTNSMIKAYAEQFQETNVSIVDIDSKLFQDSLKNDNERMLYHYAVEELAAMQSGGGNPAAASDIVRLLSPCYSKGIYIDFDVDVPVLGNEPTHLELPSGLSFPTKKASEFCNDVIAVSHEPLAQSAQDLLDGIQQQIIANYRAANINDYEPIDMQNQKGKELLDDMSETINTVGFDAVKNFRKKIGDARKNLHQDIARIERDISNEENKYKNVVSDGEKDIIDKRVEDLKQKKEQTESTDRYLTKAYMQSVMMLTGPNVYREAFYDIAKQGGTSHTQKVNLANELECPELYELFPSQLFTGKNESSWVQKKDEFEIENVDLKQESENNQTLKDSKNKTDSSFEKNITHHYKESVKVMKESDNAIDSNETVEQNEKSSPKPG